MNLYHPIGHRLTRDHTRHQLCSPGRKADSLHRMPGRNHDIREFLQRANMRQTIRSHRTHPLPRIQGSYVLFDGTSLSPKALIDGIAITNLRTPAVSISCTYDFFADQDATSPLRVAIFGTGPQGRAHAATVESTFPQRDCSITFISRTEPDALDDSYHWAQAGSAEAREADRGADLILCTTTAAEPIVQRDDVADNAVIVAVGSHSPDARELSTDLVAASHVIVEDMEATLREGGDIIQPLNEGAIKKDDLFTFADVVSGKVTIKRDRPIVFKFTGMPWEDLALAEAIADKLAPQH